MSKLREATKSPDQNCLWPTKPALRKGTGRFDPQGVATQHLAKRLCSLWPTKKLRAFVVKKNPDANSSPKTITAINSTGNTFINKSPP